MTRWLTISWWLSAGVRLQIVRAGIGAVVGAAFTIALCTLGESSREALVEQLLGGGEQIRAVQPEGPEIKYKGVDLLSSITNRPLFSADDVQELEDIEGVAEVWPEAWSRYSVWTTAKFPLVNARPGGDAVLLGVPFQAVQSELIEYAKDELADADGTPEELAQAAWDWQPPKDGEEAAPIPVAIPRSVIAAYNSGFQPAHPGWPTIDDEFARQISLQFCPGDALYSKKKRKCELKLEGEIIIVTPYAGELAAIVPIEAVHWIGEQLGEEEVPEPRGFSSVMMILDTGADPDHVKAEIAKRDWETQEVGSAAKNLALALRAIDLGVAVAGAVIVLAALALLAQVYGVLLRERRNDIRVLRALGSTRSSLGLALISEVGLASLMAAVTGVLLGVAIAYAAGPTVGGYLHGILGAPVVVAPSPPAWLTWGMIIGTPVVAMLSVLRPVFMALKSR